MEKSLSEINIPIIDGSRELPPEEANLEAYKKLQEQSERINNILQDGQLVEDGHGLENIPEHVDEMGDSIAREIDFEGKKEKPKKVKSARVEADGPSEESEEDEEEPSDESIGQLEEQFNQNAHVYESQSRDDYYRQLDAERPYLIQRQQEMEAELQQLRAQKEATEEENLKNWEAKILEGINIAADLGREDQKVVLIRELGRIDRMREERERNKTQIYSHPFTQQQVQPNIPPQGYNPYQMPMQPQMPIQQMPQQPMNPYVMTQYGLPQQGIPQATQPIYQHPFTSSNFPTKPSQGTPTTSAPKASSFKKNKSEIDSSSMHPYLLRMLETHTLPPGMKKEDYINFAAKQAKNVNVKES